MSDLAERIVAAARMCLDTPFRHQGRLPGVGLDCAGLVVASLQAAGVEVTDYHGYGRIPNEGRLRKAVDDQPGLTAVAVDALLAGDVVLMRFGYEPTHLGIITCENHMIHAYERIGRVVEHRLDPVWQAQMVGAWRAKVAA